MAGAKSRRGDRSTLAERIHGDPPPASPVKPCWVTDRHGRHPGLLLEWRPVQAGWRGRVVRPVIDSSGWVVVEVWLAAELLEASP